MNHADFSRAIQERLAYVDDQIARFKALLPLHEAERTELMTALRVIQRLDRDAALAAPQELQSQPTVEVEPPIPPPEKQGGRKKKPGKRKKVVVYVKPAGLPTMAEMILTVLEGHGAMEPNGILADIRLRWWPGAASESVGPIAWRMWKQGRLAKTDDGLYSLPKSETPAGEAAGASEPSPSSNGLFDHPAP